MISFTRDMTAASGDVSYTGVGFQPLAVLAWGHALATRFWGMTSGPAAADAGYMNFRTDTSDFDNGSTTFLALEDNGSVPKRQMGVLKSLDADGFTITWTKAGAPTGTGTIKCLCLGFG